MTRPALGMVLAPVGFSVPGVCGGPDGCSAPARYFATVHVARDERADFHLCASCGAKLRAEFGESVVTMESLAVTA